MDGLVMQAPNQDYPLDGEIATVPQTINTQYIEIPKTTNVIYIQAPKYSNWPMRLTSMGMIGLGVFIYFLGAFFPLMSGSPDISIWPTISCCGLWWGSMIPELIYYHGMRTHNLSTGGGTGWAITNLIGGYTVLVIGGFFLFLMLIGASQG